MLSIADILGPQGRIAARLTNYEHRTEQLRMAEAVRDAIAGKHHLVVEAGTGVGKSFGYLVPAILAVTEGEAKQERQVRRVVLSTHTISLQEQLLFKDLPFLNSVIPRDFSSVLVKGRSNYVSLRRLHLAAQRAGSMFFHEEELDQLRELVAWTKSTSDGSLTDLGFRPKSIVWDEAASESTNCLGRNCPSYRDCFFYKARRRVANAQLLVVNHALLLSDLALREAGASLLPDYDVVVIDEAHTLETVAAAHLGFSVSSGQVNYALHKLYNPQANKGLLVHLNMVEAQQRAYRCMELADDLFHEVYEQTRERGAAVRVRAPGMCQDHLSPQLSALGQMLQKVGEQVRDENERQDLQSAAQRLVTLAGSIRAWLEQSVAGNVYWAESAQTRRGMPRIKLATAPVDVGASLRTQLYDQRRSVILTSATLSVGKEEDFRFFRTRIGLTQARSLKLGSPFNYRDQARVILVEGMQDPGQHRQGYERQVVEMVRRYVQRTDGRAFVLFTSYEMLRSVSRRLAPWLAEQNLALLSQDEHGSRSAMLEAFKANPRAVLFGADSFWQGVDVPGDALQNVIITKLPFSVPDHPLLEARLDAIRAEGREPFYEYQLPEAVIKFRQGFGRLIRTQRDTGIVVILDPRIRTKGYGRVFLESLPDCEIITEEV